MAIVRNPKTGKIIVKRFSIKTLERADQDYDGFCIACGNRQQGCEPDARKYQCEICGLNHVYGAAEIALMGLTK